MGELESMEISSTSMTMATLVVETAIPMALPTPWPLETPLARPTQETIPSILSSRLVQLASRLASPPLWASVSTVQKQPLVPPLATPWPSLMWRLRRSMTELVVLSTLTQRPLTLPRALESTEATSFLVPRPTRSPREHPLGAPMATARLSRPLARREPWVPSVLQPRLLDMDLEWRVPVLQSPVAPLPTDSVQMDLPLLWASMANQQRWLWAAVKS